MVFSGASRPEIFGFLLVIFAQKLHILRLRVGNAFCRQNGNYGDEFPHPNDQKLRFPLSFNCRKIADFWCLFGAFTWIYEGCPYPSKEMCRAYRPLFCMCVFRGTFMFCKSAGSWCFTMFQQGRGMLQCTFPIMGRNDASALCCGVLWKPLTRV